MSKRVTCSALLLFFPSACLHCLTALACPATTSSTNSLTTPSSLTRYSCRASTTALVEEVEVLEEVVVEVEVVEVVEVEMVVVHIKVVGTCMRLCSQAALLLPPSSTR